MQFKSKIKQDYSQILPEIDWTFLKKEVLPYIANPICGDLFMEQSKIEQITMSNGKITGNGNTNIEGFSLRKVTDKHLMFFNSSTHLSMEKIKEFSKNLELFPSYPTLLRSKEVRDTTHNTNFHTQVKMDKKLEEIYGLLNEIYHYIMNYRNRDNEDKNTVVKSSIINYSFNDNHREIYNEQDDFVMKNHKIWRLSITITLEKNGDTYSYSKGISSQKGFSFLVDHWKELVCFIWQGAYDNLVGENIYAGNSTILMGAGEPGVLLHEAIGHAAESDLLSMGASCLSNKKGTKIATDIVNVIDDGTLEGERGHIYYDDEGTPSQRNTIIQDGYFIGELGDKFYGHKRGIASTGNGRRQSFAHNVLPRMTNTFLTKGNASLSTSKLLTSIEDGIYAVDFGGGQVNTTTGDFVFEARLAYKVKNGKILHPVKGAMLMGNVLSTLKNISAIGDDESLCNGSGNCGKDGQSVPVCVGCPSFVIHNITVGGK